MKSFKGLKIVIVALLLIFFLLLLNLTSFGKGFKNLFYSISSPVQKWLWKTGGEASDFFEAITEIKNLKKENEELKLQNQDLLSKIFGLEELKKENEELRNALNLGLGEEFKLKFAQVIAKEMEEDSLIINLGLKDGISTSSPVITSQKVLVGRITEVYQNFSKVMLISNKKSSFDAKIYEKETEGIVKGRGESGLYIDLVPQDVEISPGDVIVSSALSGNFPEGLLVGKIAEVKKSDLEPFQKAELLPFFDLNGAEKLFIITEF